MVASKKSTTQQRKKSFTAGKKSADKSKTHSKAEAAITFDRRGQQNRRRGPDRRTTNVPVNVERRAVERRAKVNRRRQIDPTTCERDYTHDEIEFMNAMDNYKRSSGRMFPTCSEVLEVIKSLGYEKSSTPQPEPTTMPSVEMSVTVPTSLMTVG